jgi:hypothetical protein
MDHSYLVSDDKQELKLAMPTSLLGLPQDVLNLILTDLASHTIFLVRRCCRAIRRAVRLFLSSRLVRPLVLGEELPSRREVVAFLSTAKEHDLSRFVSFHTRSRDCAAGSRLGRLRSPRWRPLLQETTIRRRSASSPGTSSQAPTGRS